MLKITVEIYPQGREEGKQILGIAKISNDGTGNSEVGNYKIEIMNSKNPKKVWKTGYLKGFKRGAKNSNGTPRFGVWELLAAGLIATLKNRIIQSIITNPDKL